MQLEYKAICQLPFRYIIPSVKFEPNQTKGLEILGVLILWKVSQPHFFGQVIAGIIIFLRACQAKQQCLKISFVASIALTGKPYDK